MKRPAIKDGTPPGKKNERPQKENPKMPGIPSITSSVTHVPSKVLLLGHCDWTKPN